MFSSFGNRKLISLIVAGSLIASLAYAFYFRIHPVVDAKAYDTIAQHIVFGHGFRENIDRDIAQDYAIVRAGPGYEYFLAGIYRIFGYHYTIIWTAQAVLHAFTAYLLYLIARKVFSEHGEKIGVVTAFLFGFWPDLIEISAMLMTETLYLFFTTLAVYVFVRAYEKPENRLLAGLLGFTVGIGILTRPPLLLFVPIFIFFYFRAKQYRQIGIYLAALIIALSPWILRNYFVYHQLILTTLIGEYNLWIGNTLLSDGGQISGGFNPVTDYIDRHGVFDLKDAAGEAFQSFVVTHPVIFLKLCLLRFVRYFSLIRPMGFWFYQTGIGQMLMVGSSLLWTGIAFLAGFAGLTGALREKKPLHYYLAAMAATSPLVLLPTVVQSRYRFQIYPFLALFAGYLVYRLIQKNISWKNKAVVLPAVFLLIVSLLDAVLHGALIAERLQKFFE